jgi:hypothetical protein
MRVTLHLVTADDYLAWAPALAPERRRRFESSPFRKQLPGVDLEALSAEAEELLAEAPHGPAELGRRLAARWPDADPTALGYAGVYRATTVQVTPRGMWGRFGRARVVTGASWLGRDVPEDGPPDDLVRRYLAAFRPASVADIAAWSGLSGVRGIVERLRPELAIHEAEDGRELLDLPDAPLPEEDTPAPPRFLPEFDNVLVAYAERSRVAEREHVKPETGRPVLLVDGFPVAHWRHEQGEVRIDFFREIGREPTAAVAEEAHRLAAFLAS